MKNTIITLFLLVFNVLGCSCHAQKINETAVTFLVDVTDQSVFSAIKADFNRNLNAFFVNTGVGKIDYGQRLVVRMGAIDEGDQLTLQSRSIALVDKRVSRKEAERLRNPRPLVEMIGGELDRYEQLSEKTMASSPIIDVTLKAFREMNAEAREIVVICTDGVEYSNYANFYKNIPTTEKTLEKLISKVDPFLLSEAKEQIAMTDPEVVIVLKANDKVKHTADLKKFYSEFMNLLGVHTTRFVDNLSNNPNL